MEGSAQSGDVAWGRGSLGNVVEMDGILASKVKFLLQVLLSDLYIAQGHADIFVPQQLHESRQADAEA